MATQMLAGKKYRIYLSGTNYYCEGYFFDNKYYEGMEQAPMGEVLENGIFIYRKLMPDGTPIFLNNVGGKIFEFTLTRIDGSIFYIVDMT